MLYVNTVFTSQSVLWSNAEHFEFPLGWHLHISTFSVQHLWLFTAISFYASNQRNIKDKNHWRKCLWWGSSLNNNNDLKWLLKHKTHIISGTQWDTKQEQHGISIKPFFLIEGFLSGHVLCLSQPALSRYHQLRACLLSLLLWPPRHSWQESQSTQKGLKVEDRGCTSPSISVIVLNAGSYFQLKKKKKGWSLLLSHKDSDILPLSLVSLKN